MTQKYFSTETMSKKFSSVTMNSFMFSPEYAPFSRHTPGEGLGKP